MQIDRMNVARIASIAFKNVNSFLMVEPRDVLQMKPGLIDELEVAALRYDALIDESEKIVGVYANGLIDVLILTDFAVHCVTGKTKTIVPYDAIVEVMKPSEFDQHIDLAIAGGDCVCIPVLNETEELPDVHAMYDFLSLVTNARNINWSLLKLIDSREQLICHVDSTFRRSPHRSRIEDWLIPEAVLEFGFAHLNIGQDKARLEEAWRLIALILELNFDSDN